MERYVEIEEVLNQKAEYKNPLSGFEIKNRDEVEQAAKKLRKKWHLGDAPISNLMELLEDKGISFSRGAELLNMMLPEFRRKVQIVS